MKKFIGILLCLFSLSTDAANTILIVGDSLSAGFGIKIAEGWVSLLKERIQKNNFDYQVVNASISGDTTSNGLARLPSALKQPKPTITIIELGANDGLRELDIATIKNNLQQMITLIKKSHSQVLLLGLHLPPQYSPEYRAKFKALFIFLAKKNNISVVPNFLNNVDTRVQLFQPDRLHPKAEAQELILNNVWVVLEKMLR